ncbi:unnamed protein product, partial [marine sediment metagenome]
MRKMFLLCLTILLSFSLVFLSISSESAGKQEGNILQEEFVPNEVLVRFKKDVHKNIIQN